MSQLSSELSALIPPYARVLDLGCGTGQLLETLIKQKHVKGYGIDIKIENIITCMEKGIPVLQSNLEDGLSGFANQSYDIVILSQTLQEILNPELVISEILRIGEKAIVTFPNYSYWKNRINLLQGQVPTQYFHPFTWYNSPNIRTISINSFREFCKEKNIQIKKEIPLFDHTLLKKTIPKKLHNLLCKKGMFLIEKPVNPDLK